MRVISSALVALLLLRRLFSPPREGRPDTSRQTSREAAPGRLAAWVGAALHAATKHPWIALLLVGTTVAAGGLAVSASGLVPIKASAGHWRVTESFLQFSKNRSIGTHAVGIDEPQLDDPALVLAGAGHYELGCRPCHGMGGNVPRIAQAMLPPPPDLASRAPLRRSAELFYVIKHGIKLTGMPAWPAKQRDDEVWAVVAFLRKLPDLDREAYRRLTRGEPSQPFELVPDDEQLPEVVRDTCARCHGVDGQGRQGGTFPKLAGQRRQYLDNALRAYADGQRQSGIMSPIAAALTPDTRAQVVAYYGRLRPMTSPDRPRTGDERRGELLARTGDPGRMIPACVECHGTADDGKNPAYPILDGQPAQYLALQLRLLQKRARGGSDYVHLMHSFVDRLTAEQIEELSSYFAAGR